MSKAHAQRVGFVPLSANRSRALAIGLILAATLAGARVHAETYPLDMSLQPRGSVSFQVHTQRSWANGAGRKREDVTLLKVPDLATVTVRQSEQSVAFGWRW